ncbi:MAG TPA: response regulator [Stellaceae bacterium]|nr:response regulator [Stellaceae bacterium]
MDRPTVLIVEAELLIRHPLAEYLRECGYRVVEAANADEARQIIAAGMTPIEVVLADVEAPAVGGFALSTWIRKEHRGIQVILAGSPARAVEKAGGLCEDGPYLARPYDHQLVLARIRRQLAARDRKDG